MHVVHGCRRRRCGRGAAANLNNLCTALGHLGDHLLAVPVLVHLGVGVGDIRELASGVVAPNRHLGEIGGGLAGLQRKLAQGAVVVQAHQSVELGVIQIRRIIRRDKGIGISRVAHNEHTDIARGVVIDGLALLGEDGAISLQQVGALHSLAARASTYKKGGGGILKGFLEIISNRNGVNQRQGGVIELHGNTLGLFHRSGNFQQC